MQSRARPIEQATPTIARASCSLCRTRQSRPASASVLHGVSRGADYCEPQSCRGWHRPELPTPSAASRRSSGDTSHAHRRRSDLRPRLGAQRICPGLLHRHLPSGPAPTRCAFRSDDKSCAPGSCERYSLRVPYRDRLALGIVPGHARCPRAVVVALVTVSGTLTGQRNIRRAAGQRTSESLSKNFPPRSVRLALPRERSMNTCGNGSSFERLGTNPLDVGSGHAAAVTLTIGSC